MFDGCKLISLNDLAPAVSTASKLVQDEAEAKVGIFSGRDDGNIRNFSSLSMI